MTDRQYEKWSAPFRRFKYGKKLLRGINGACSASVFISYPCFLLLRLIAQDKRLFYWIIVPAISFGLVSLMRIVLNFPRPYEKLSIDPLIAKKTKGKSFPSRHAFSSFMIALTVVWVYPFWGGCLIVIALLQALCRILGGVHFPVDVLAGIGCALLASLIYLV